MFGGDFYVSPLPASMPAVSLVFVQSRIGNTGAKNPSELGGGPTDLHLIYEGLSRVAADAVLAGATTAGGTSTFFSVWHPELVALRTHLGLARHPAQVVLSGNGRVDVENTLLFNVPDVPVFILAGEVCRERCAEAFRRRPWITILPIGVGGLAGALAALRREHGIQRISSIGGRGAASSLIDAGVVQDLYLTTTSRDAGEPNTPFYTGKRPPAFDLIVRKQGTDPDLPIVVEQLALLGHAEHDH
jgi:riboflavin biosynthesis pyrimidine reductase